MTPPEDLQKWLGERALQRRTSEASDAFAAEWNASDVHRRFDDAVNHPANACAKTLSAALQHLFEDDEWIGTLIGRLATEMKKDPFFEPPFPYIKSDIHEGLVVFRDPRVSIAVGVTQASRLAAKKQAPRAAASIGLTGQLTILKFVRAGDAAISLWEAPRVTADFTGADAGRCIRAGERRLADGDILVIDGRHQGYVIEHARSNLLILQAEISQDRAPVRAEYDAATLAYIGCSATDDTSTRIQMITTLLRKLDRPSAFAAVAGCLDHPDFFVRWHVMRELLGLDAEAAWPHLANMAGSDPHPEVRNAARAVLDRIDNPQPRTRKAA